MSHDSGVVVRVTEEVIPTYLPAPPDKHPMFLQRRVYQGSSGKVYPLPFTDRVDERPTDRAWRAIWLENEYVRLMILPEIGGRIHLAQDKTNGYDFIYRQSVIKPALVGLAGPWISGGIELNWPQHHRPATFLPAQIAIEEHADGAKTVWLSDHDPLSRMKGMHGVCLHPGRSAIELKVRAYNRTPLVQTFLWWANVAVRVHESYQSFFPPDVFYVADHAKRATSEFPRCRGRYYGVDYGRRAVEGVPAAERPAAFTPPHAGGRGPVDYPPDDLSWYANIPVPTSYMAMGSQEDFFGGYDHAAQAGLVHVADHHIAPGKKQWTWGNHEFGYAWDRNLTDRDGPYIELMAGVYTDNQPDFSFLQPGETKFWSQCWYPIRQIGPPQAANRLAAVSLRLEKRTVRVGVSVCEPFPKAEVVLTLGDRTVARFTRDLSPGSPLVESIDLPRPAAESELRLRVADAAGRELIAFQPRPAQHGEAPPPATEPPLPPEIASADELYLTGLHLEQYRHTTRCPTLYWREALRRDPLDSRCNHAMGLWHLRRGEWLEAEDHLRRAIERWTRRNPNPYDGQPYYDLGLCLRFQLDGVDRPDSPAAQRLFREAYSAFYKATWNQAWVSAGHHALAELDCRRAQWEAALAHLERSLRRDPDNLRARDLRSIVLRKLGRTADADAALDETLALDPLDAWARHLAGRPPACDASVRLDVAHDCARAGLYDEALAVLAQADQCEDGDLPTQNLGTRPLAAYTRGWLCRRAGDERSARVHCRQAASEPPDYCFPARLEEIAVFESTTRADPNDARAPYYLGNLFYDRRRHEEAIALWERSVRLDPSHAVAWRNLGIGYYNVRRDPAKARRAYERAWRADPTSARTLFERDQLWKRLGESPKKRLQTLRRHRDLVAQRDDLSVELCALCNQTGRHAEALQLICGRAFQPWEGGEGQSLGQHVRSRLALGRAALRGGDATAALEHFHAAAASPPNLGEAKHLLANQSDIHYEAGCALAALGQVHAARRSWSRAAEFRGDFQEMSARPFSEMTYYSAMALRRLGKKAAAARLLSDLLAYAEKLRRTRAAPDYFATSLPTMLLFDDDLQARQETIATFLEAQARLGLGQKARARALLRRVLRRDPNHAAAADFLRDEADAA